MRVDLPELSSGHLLLFLLGRRFWASSPIGGHSVAVPFWASVLREGPFITGHNQNVVTVRSAGPWTSWDLGMS